MKEMKVVTKTNDMFGKTQMASVINVHFRHITTNCTEQSPSQESNGS
jgi:hypothetical protein